MTIEEVLKKSKVEFVKDELKREIIDADVFYTKLMYYIKSRMRYGNSTYFIDDNNRDLIEQLYYYFIGDVKFNGNLNKGVLLSGAIGCGKTILLSSFFELFTNFYEEDSKIWLHSTDLMGYIEDCNNDSRHNKRIIFIDDIGKESHDYKNYGNVIFPFEDFVRKRYNQGFLNFGTTNYKLDDMEYVKHTKDRMIEMYNIIEYPGKSRRS